MITIILPYKGNIPSTVQKITFRKSDPLGILNDINSKLKPGEYILKLKRGTFILNKLENVDLDRSTFESFYKAQKIEFHEEITLMRASSDEDIVDDFLEPKPRLTEMGSKGRYAQLICNWRGKEYTLIQDKQSGLVWGDDSIELIRLKCFLLVPGTLIATVARVVYHLGICLIGQGSMENFYDIFRAPLFGVAATVVAIYGIFKPLHARPMYHTLERLLHRQEPGQIDWGAKYYRAPCFTPWSIKPEHRVEEIEKMLIKVTVLRKKLQCKFDMSICLPQLITLDFKLEKDDL